MDVVFSWLLRKRKNLGGGEAALYQYQGNGGWRILLQDVPQCMFKTGEEEGTRKAVAVQSLPYSLNELMHVLTLPVFSRQDTYLSNFAQFGTTCM